MWLFAVYEGLIGLASLVTAGLLLFLNALDSRTGDLLPDALVSLVNTAAIATGIVMLIRLHPHSRHYWLFLLGSSVVLSGLLIAVGYEACLLIAFMVGDLAWLAYWVVSRHANSLFPVG